MSSKNVSGKRNRAIDSFFSSLRKEDIQSGSSSQDDYGWVVISYHLVLFTETLSQKNIHSDIFFISDLIFLSIQKEHR